jgi:hypothetical protein
MEIVIMKASGRDMRTRGTLITSILMVVATVFANGQGPDFRLLTPSVSDALPPEISIQSGAKIGTNLLLVAGTTTPGNDSSEHFQLRGQLFHGSVPVGSQEACSSPEAEPYGVVSVIALDSQFVVLWNDRRPSVPGIYMRRVSASGEFIGVEELFSPGKLISDYQVYSLRFNGGYQLVWTDSRESAQTIYSRHLTESGNPTGEEIYLGTGSAARVTVTSFFRDVIIVQRSAGPGIVISSDYSVHSAPAIPVSSAPFYIDSRRLVSIQDTVLSIYDSLNSQQPTRTVNIPLVREAYGNLVTVYIDSLEVIHVLYPIVYTYGPVYIMVRSIDIPGSGQPVAPVGMDTIVFTGIGGSVRNGPDGGSRVSMYCDNNSVTTVKFWAYTDFAGSGRPIDDSSLTTFSYGIHNRVYEHLIYGNLQCSGCASDCFGRTPVAIFRYNGGSYFNIVVDSANMRVSKMLAHMSQPHYRPNLFWHRDTLVLTWINGHTTFRATDFPESVGIGTWSIPLDTIRQLSPLVIPVGDPAGYSYFKLSAGSGLSVSRVHSEFTNKYPGISYIIDNDYWYYLARPSGWKIVRFLHQERGSSTNSAAASAFVSMAFEDPATGSMIAEFKIPTATISSFGTSDSLEWTTPLSMPDSGIVDFVGTVEHQVVAATSNELVTLANGTRISAVQLPRLSGITDQYYRRLLGPYIIRGFSMATSGKQYAQLFTLNGDNLGMIELPTTGSSSRPAVVQNPTDSSIAFLFAGHSGVRLTYCDKYLNVRFDMASHQETSDLHVSQTGDSVTNVAGTFMGDTLRVVWEDFRNSSSDIYANLWVVPKTLGSPSTRHDYDPPLLQDSSGSAIAGSGDVAITGLYPNPAHSYITAEFTTSTQGDISMEIVDMLGRRIGQIAGGTLHSGRYQWGMNCSGLAPGAYVVIVRSALGSDQRRVIVEPF